MNKMEVLKYYKEGFFAENTENIFRKHIAVWRADLKLSNSNKATQAVFRFTVRRQRNKSKGKVFSVLPSEWVP